MKQYMPLKPIKRGYKVWCLCDARNGYAYNIQVYMGASAGSNEDTLGSRVVKNIVKPIKGRGHHVYMDNFFTSVSSAKDLLDDNTFMIGAARLGRKGWPQVLKEVKALKKALKKRGESKSVVVEDGKVECLVWKDNTVVPLVNTITKPQEMTHVKRTNKDGSKIDVSCPESIKSYNKFMGGVDLFDSRRKTYSCSRRSKKWWLHLFYFLLDTTTVNAFLLHQQCHGKKSLKEFILELSTSLLASHTSRKRPNTVQAPIAARLQERHFLDTMEDPHQCVVCPERRRSRVCCRDCDPEHPIPLCITPCFRIHHTVEKTKKKKSKK